MSKKVILVDEDDNKIGTKEKLSAHKGEGQLHRAFSIFIFNSDGELLLQKRADHKYHSGGLWTNTCCSHPEPGEDIIESGKRRLEEEMGFKCDLKEVFHFTYSANFDNGLSENEYDHVLFGVCDKKPDPNPEEVSDWKWISIEDLKEDIKKNPDSYTHWFKIGIDKVIEKAKEEDLIN